MIRLCHAFASLMDLYGDYANMRVLAQRLKDIGQQVEYRVLPRFEGFDPDNTDMLFIGPGTEQSAMKACEEIGQYAGKIEKYLEKGGIVLLCGNAPALFGKGINAGDESRPGLGIIDSQYTVSYRLRRYSEILADGPWGETVGTINTSCSVSWGGDPMFKVNVDTDRLSNGTEGMIAGNIYATEITGPLLVNNPAACDYFVEKLCGKLPEKDTEGWYGLAVRAHDRFLGTLKEAASK